VSEELERQLAPINRRDNALVLKDSQSQLVARARRDIAVFLPDTNNPLFQLRQQAESGDTDAQVKLGNQYRFLCGWCSACLSGKPCQGHGPGILFHECLREAAAWYLKAAELGNVDGQIKIAHAYVDGIGVPQNQSEAERWLRSAAEQGDMWGQYELGRAYREGKGMPQDPLEAIRWYLKAADQRHLYAMQDLGNMYEDGEGIPQSTSEALRYFAMATDDDWDYGEWDPDCFTGMWMAAAEYGFAKAQYLYGEFLFSMFYKHGCTSLDPVKASMWLSLAATSGETRACKLRDELAAKLSEDQLAEADRRVHEWKPKT
jgi:uncharacterized protein